MAQADGSDVLNQALEAIGKFVEASVVHNGFLDIQDPHTAETVFAETAKTWNDSTDTQGGLPVASLPSMYQQYLSLKREAAT